jgi:hypothetical protein
MIAVLKANKLSVVKYRNSMMNIDASGVTNFLGISKL